MGSSLRARRTAMAGLFALGAGLAAEAAAAAVTDPVPLPRPRPQIASASAPADSGGSILPKFLQPKKKAAAANPGVPQTQRELLAGISGYFNSFRTMEGQFVQVGPNGEQSEGVFFISKPGKIRFHYRPPVKLDVISDGSSVAIRDNKAMTQDLYPLSKTPLRYLLADRIDLTDGGMVSEVREDKDTIAIVIVQKSAFVDGKLTMIFDRNTYELKQWIVTDAQGLDTSVAIFGVATGKPQDPSYFKIVVNQKAGGRQQ
jgi:outer membrane lipoprotein-sorting protein